MARVDGFEVSFTHRGSWKAHLVAPGKEPEIIPVAWKTDWEVKEKALFVWLKNEEEIDALLAEKSRFRVAIAIKNADGSASSEKIACILWVTPVTKSFRPRLGLNCSVEERARP